MREPEPTWCRKPLAQMLPRLLQIDEYFREQDPLYDGTPADGECQIPLGNPLQLKKVIVRMGNIYIEK